MSGGGFSNTPVVKAVGKKLTPKDSPVAGRTRSKDQTDVTVFLSRTNKVYNPRRLMNIGALPRRCRLFSRTESGPLKSQEQYKTQRRSASALFPIAHKKTVFVVGS